MTYATMMNFEGLNAAWIYCCEAQAEFAFAQDAGDQIFLVAASADRPALD